MFAVIRLHSNSNLFGSKNIRKKEGKNEQLYNEINETDWEC